MQKLCRLTTCLACAGLTLAAEVRAEVTEPELFRVVNEHLLSKPPARLTLFARIKLVDGSTAIPQTGSETMFMSITTSPRALSRVRTRQGSSITIDAAPEQHLRMRCECRSGAGSTSRQACVASPPRNGDGVLDQSLTAIDMAA